MPQRHETTLRVTYRDTDKMGVVYHANYLVYMEVGRVELLRSMGCTYRELEDIGFGIPLIRCAVDYRQSAHYDDLLYIDATMKKVSRRGIAFDYRVTREEDGERVLLATGSTEHLFMDGGGKLVRASQRFVDGLERGEANAHWALG